MTTLARLVLMTAAGTLLAYGGLAQAQGPVVQVQAVAGGSALLPCDITPPLANDSVLLVIWYKNEMTPIYSYDTRGAQPERGSHWKEKGILAERGYFRTMSEPATFNLESIDERDEGDYRCRVDFKKSPTRNTKVRLTVVVPPQKPNIVDERGKEVQNVAGPYEEGAELKLTCIVSGGKPTPTLRWWRDDHLVDSIDVQSSFPNVKQNQLYVRRLERADLHATYTCKASNNNISQPVFAKVSLEMHFKPISASILSSSQSLSAERKYELVCESVGSRPPTKISWWKDNKKLENYTEKVSADGNMTTSTLMFTPTMIDHEKTITCRADNPRVQAGVEEDTWKLNVLYVPIVNLSLGSSLNPEDIEEGDDVYFECKVNANPIAYKVVWKHNGQVVLHNQKSGVIMSNGDLALQGVKKQQAGNYTCTASNIEGDGESNAVELRVMYKPICKVEQKRVYGVARNEHVNVVCEVQAYPPPETFKWSFNNTAETFDVPKVNFQTGAYESNLTYKPITEMDYGTVMCSASNTAGLQQEPCVFHIIAAGHPDTPYNCSVVNQTSGSVEVECLEGFDGGQQQFFQIEVYDVATAKLVRNASSPYPVFDVHALEPGRVLKMVIYAANSKGKSESVTIEGFTLKAMEKQAGISAAFEFASILGVLISVLISLFLAAIVVVAALSLRSQNAMGHSLVDHPIKEKSNVNLHVEDLYEKDDKNPDVIPCPKDSDYQLVASFLPISNTSPDSNIYCADEAALNGDLYKRCNINGNFTSTLLKNENAAYAELFRLNGANNTFKGPDCGRIDGADFSQHPQDGGGQQSPMGILEMPPSREIVTVKTLNQQESCV
ncbi:synaptogenesis protein syg-2-like isoform X2 [Cloeon dipterum]|uniref:synaptogenesis protein syg-2-like isoform X2 n=1 Tax=Cloeon dipterum TaxID=197152 RepID=UPI0032207121